MSQNRNNQMLPQTGERQVAENIEGIKPNHRERYQFAINKIKENFQYNSTMLNILDAACGIGYGTWMIAEQIKHATVTGADIFQDAVDAANRAYKLDNNGFIQLDLGDAAAWDKNIIGRMDAIVSIETIEHVLDAEALIARYTKTTDFLIGSVPNQDVVPFHKEQHPFHFRHYTKGEFEQLLNDYGFFIDVWATQYNKIPGIVYEDADDGMGFIVSARKK